MMDVRLPESGAVRRLGPLLSFVALLMLVSVSCALGPNLAQDQRSAQPTPTKTLRPTFTPVGGAAQPGAGGVSLLGPQPPGVTVQAPLAATVESPSGDGAVIGEGSTNLVLVATETSLPTATVIQRTPFVKPSATVDTETNRPTREPGARAEPTPHVVVEADQLSGRRGPGESYERVGQAAKGDELMIMARTADNQWWQVCCLANQPVWVSAAQVSARGAVDQVATVEPGPPPPPTQRPAPVPRPPPTTTPLPRPTPLPPFDVARGPEFPLQRDNGLMTVWVRVYEGAEPYTKALPGYVLKVLRNDQEVSLPTQSSDLTDSTGPQQGNYLYNLKFEMVDAGEADWQIYLATPDGARVSPITKFTTMGDSYRNLVAYIAYWRAR